MKKKKLQKYVRSLLREAVIVDERPPFLNEPTPWNEAGTYRAGSATHTRAYRQLETGEWEEVWGGEPLNEATLFETTYSYTSLPYRQARRAMRKRH